MSNYVNNVNVAGTNYTLGPLMSTAYSGVVDNRDDISGDLTEGHNVFIGTYSISANGGSFDGDVVIGGSVSLSGYSDLLLWDTCVLGGMLNCFSDYDIYHINVLGGHVSTHSYDNFTAIGCNYSITTSYYEPDSAIAEHKVFLGCDVPVFYPGLILGGTQVVQAAGVSALDSAAISSDNVSYFGFAGKLTRTYSYDADVSTPTDIAIPRGGFYALRITAIGIDGSYFDSSESTNVAYPTPLYGALDCVIADGRFYCSNGDYVGNIAGVFNRGYTSKSSWGYVNDSLTKHMSTSMSSDEFGNTYWSVDTNQHTNIIWFDFVRAAESTYIAFKPECYGYAPGTVQLTIDYTCAAVTPEEAESYESSEDYSY